jgi:hypothetical protein
MAEYLAPHVSQGNLNFGIAAGLLFGVLSVANLLLGAGVSLSKEAASGRALGTCCVLPVLFALSFANRLLPSFFLRDPSGQTLSDELKRNRIPTGKLNVYKHMNRGQRYSLNFYLHEEIPEWDGEHPHQGYLLMGYKHSRSELGSDYTFEEVPFDLKKTGYFLYKVQSQSAAGTASRGQPK